MMKQIPLHQFIADRFSFEELAVLCYDLGTNIDNLPGSTMARKSLELVTQMSRYLRTDRLLAEIALSRPDLDVQPYLYLLVSENFNGAELAELCQKLELDCDELGLGPQGTVGVDYDRYMKDKKAMDLQDAALQEGKFDQLVENMGEMKNYIHLEAYRRPEPKYATKEALPVGSVDVRQTLSSAGQEISTLTPAPPPTPEPERVYEDFNIGIGWPRGDTYPIRVISSPAGESEEEWVSIPMDQIGYQALMNRLAAGDVTEDDIVEFGRRIGQVMFGERAWNIFYTSLVSMKHQGMGLRIRLFIDPPELNRIPWEYCYRKPFNFLATDAISPIVRYIAPAYTTSAGKPVFPEQIRVLLAIASPNTLPPVDADAEGDRIMDAVSWAGNRARVRILTNPTPDSLYDALNELKTQRPSLHQPWPGRRPAGGPDVRRPGWRSLARPGQAACQPDHLFSRWGGDPASAGVGDP